MKKVNKFICQGLSVRALRICVIALITLSTGNFVLAQTGNETQGDGSGTSMTTGDYNSFFGDYSGFTNTIGSFNSFVGYESGYSNTSGDLNSFFGRTSGYSNTTGGWNSFVGVGSGNKNTTGNYNSFFGQQSGFSNTGGNENTFVGRQSGYSNTTASYNSFVGYRSGYSNTTGTHNSFVGYLSGYSNTIGNWNSFFGHESGYSNTTGTTNSFFGRTSGYSNTTGGWNSFFGHGSGYSNISGNYNSFFGQQSGYNNTTGYNNSFVGRQSGYSNTTGFHNSAVGYRSGYSNTTGFHNSFFGHESGYSNTEGNYNSFFGHESGYSNTTGGLNSFFGRTSGKSNTTGGWNSFVGVGSGINNTEGNYNSFFGQQSGFSNTTGSNNTFIGRQSGYNTLGSGNVFLGHRAGHGETGSNKLYIANSEINPPLIYGDFSTGRLGLGTITPSVKLVVESKGGTAADRVLFDLQDNNNPAQLLIMGHTGGTNHAQITTNDRNSRLTVMASDGADGAPRISFIGPSDASGAKGWGIFDYGASNTDISTARMIIRYTSTSGVQEMFGAIGNTAIVVNEPGKDVDFRVESDINPHALFVRGSDGNIGVGTSNPGAYRLYVAGNAYSTGSWVGSDKRYKKSITTIAGALDKVKSLRGTSYEFDTDKMKSKSVTDKAQYGFIAQELKEVLPELVTEDTEGFYAVNYDGVVPVLVEALKEQQNMIEKQSKEIAELKQLLTGNATKSANDATFAKKMAELYQNAPNPFSNQTEIRYFLADNINSAAILVFDMHGKQLKNYELTARGNSKLVINGGEFTAGMYIYSLIADNQLVATKRMVLTSN